MLPPEALHVTFSFFKKLSLAMSFGYASSGSLGHFEANFYLFYLKAFIAISLIDFSCTFTY